MKKQTLFSSKDKSKKLKCRLLQFLFGTLRVKESFTFIILSVNAYDYIAQIYLFCAIGDIILQFCFLDLISYNVDLFTFHFK